MDYSKVFDLRDIVYFCEFEKKFKIEQWKDILGYENKYQISDLGRVKSLNYRRSMLSYFLSQGLSTNGYLCVILTKNGVNKTRTVHQLVAEAFLGHVPSRYKVVINHINHNKINNVKTNLELISNRENTNQGHLNRSSQYVGVSFHKKSKKWIVRIRDKNKQIYIGLFQNEVVASEAYKKYLAKIIDV